MTEPPVDLGALRRRLADRTGRAYWQSLEELAETPEFLAAMEEEFPRFAAAAAGAPNRRRFLQLMAASLALSGLAACGPEVSPRRMAPYVEQPAGIVPGRARYYATATRLGGYAEGVTIEHQMSRPIKVEGNPDHPASLGATSAIGQASILTLYDPFRAQTVTQRGEVETWEGLVSALAERRQRWTEAKGEGLYLLTGTVTSPTLAAQMGELLQKFPGARWHQWEALHRDTERAATSAAFGRALDPVLDLSKADVILAVESDFLLFAPGHLRYARDFAARRRADEVGAKMSRLYAIESTPTLVGAKADHRLMLAPAEIDQAMRFIAAELGSAPAEVSGGAPRDAAQLRAIAADLRQHHGRALVHAGREQPAEIHALALAINQALGTFGATWHWIEPVEAQPTAHGASLAALIRDLNAGKVDTLLILGSNAVYTAPADSNFAAALGKAGLSVYLGQYSDETAAACQWHVPEAHDYEAWSDARAFDGTVTILQPQVRPLYGGHSAHELLAVLLGDAAPDGYALLQRYWQKAHGGAGDFATFWHEALRRGVVPGTAAKEVEVAPRPNFLAALPQPNPVPPGELTLLFRADIGLWDGRFADNGWLQEMPRPFTRLTWDNVAMVAPSTAEKLGLHLASMVELSWGGRSVRAPVYILPGQAPDCITLPLGYGRSHAGPVGSGVGFNAYLLRGGDAPWQAAGATLKRLDEHPVLAFEQLYQQSAGRDLIREGDLAAYLEKPDFLHHAEADETLYPQYRYEGVAWAMSIDLNSCIGCEACVVACQAENNIPVVGKDQVHQGRAMHWLRIDRYYSGGIDAPQTAFQPVPCMHCEDAPCEVVCPVQATVHDSEGANLMIYNRCVGTRFCSNNCPYKVRRFNFFAYASRDPRPPASWNAEVTVRDRGVMEKCSYCIQRCRAALIDADRDNRPVADGEVVTACQQVCPTQAIVFGDRNDRTSAVARRKASPLDYVLLEELNTRPRTSYGAAIRNPNPAFGKESA